MKTEWNTSGRSLRAEKKNKGKKPATKTTAKLGWYALCYFPDPFFSIFPYTAKPAKLSFSCFQYVLLLLIEWPNPRNNITSIIWNWIEQDYNGYPTPSAASFACLILNYIVSCVNQ